MGNSVADWAEVPGPAFFPWCPTEFQLVVSDAAHGGYVAYSPLIVQL